jgi:signal transduction histidine kinase
MPFLHTIFLSYSTIFIISIKVFIPAYLTIVSAAQNEMTFLEKATQLHYTNIDSAWYFLEKAEEKALLADNSDSLGLVLAKKGFMLYTKGNYYASMQQFEKAYQYFNESNNIEGLSYVINGNGLIYQSQNEPQLAEEAFRQALEMSRLATDSIGIARSLLNLGFTLSKQGRSEEALQLHKEGLNYITNFPDHRFELMLKNQVANDLLNLDRLEDAEQLFLNILEEQSEINYWEQSYSYTGLAKIALKNKDFIKADKFAKSGFEYAKKISAINDMQRATEIIAIAAKELNNWEEAYNFSQLNSSLKDSLFELSRSQSLNYLQLKLSEADKNRIKTEFELTKNQALLNGYVIISLLILSIILIWAVYFFRKKNNINRKLSNKLSKSYKELEIKSENIHQKNIQLEKLNNEKVQLISVISHDLKAPFNSMQQIILLIQDNLINNQDHSKLNLLLLDQFKKTKVLMDDILEWANRQLSGIKTVTENIPVTSFIEECMLTMKKDCKLKKLKVEYPISDTTFSINADKNQFRVVIQNLCHNAIKFSPHNGLITVNYEQNEKEKCIHITDQGIGIDKDKVETIMTGKGVLRSTTGTSNEQGTGLGLLLVKQFLVNNNGYLSVKSGKSIGSTFSIHFMI